MKHILLKVLFLVTLSLSTSAQKIHFSDTTNHWVYSWGSTASECSGKVFRGFGPDTLLNGKTFRPLMDTIAPDVIGTGGSFGCYGVVRINLFIREDTTNRIVYCRHPTQDTLERILFDYNLRVGDTVSNYNDLTVPFHYCDSVSSVDSTLIGTIYYKIFNLKTKRSEYLQRWDCTYIEGVGPINYIRIPVYEYLFEYDERIICYSHNGNFPAITAPNGIYTNDTFFNNISCTILGLGDPPTIQNIQLSPNPAYSEITITSPESINEIIITNITGQVAGRYIPKNLSASIPVYNFPSGMYIVEFRSGVNGERRAFRRFIKE